MISRGLVVGGLAAAMAMLATEREAAACGGCFAPQENPTVVTDHRMIMTIEKDQSTLYDQIKYQGDPKSFAWVLPFAGEIDVGLSADIVFSALDQNTATQILPPPGCAGGSSSGGPSSASAGGNSSSGGSSSGGVTVIKKEVVGPYETVQLAATDPAALEKWLKTNGYSIPADVAPVVATYVNEHFNFLALKLVPNTAIQDMRPVRVTTKKGTTVLPLRMVAAGTGATVGISLWVLAEGRYEPQNFGSFIVDDNDLGWDVSQQKSNYTDVRAALTKKSNGSAWEVESSIFIGSAQLQSTITNGTYYQGGFGGGSSGTSGNPPTEEERAGYDYEPIKDASGNVTKTAIQQRTEDLKLLLPANQATRVTRMRADLAHAALTQDLTLRAAGDQSFLSNVRQLTRCGLPGDPTSTVITPGGPNTANPNAPAATTTSSVGGGTFTCSTTVTRTPWGTLGFAALAIAVARAMRRRRRA